MLRKQGQSHTAPYCIDSDDYRLAGASPCDERPEGAGKQKRLPSLDGWGRHSLFAGSVAGSNDLRDPGGAHECSVQSIGVLVLGEVGKDDEAKMNSGATAFARPEHASESQLTGRK